MSDPTRTRIVSAFDEELRAVPVPPGLRPLSVRAAVTAPRRRSNQPVVLALVATVVVVALVAVLIAGSHALHSTAPAPAGSTTPPAPRAAAAVAYDGQRGVLVVFGGATGQNNVTLLAETWTWDGRTWRHMHPATSPTPRQYAVMAYDQARHDIVLFGGEAADPTHAQFVTPTTDTWTWDGSNWKQMHPAHQPTFNADGGPSTMAYDPISRTVLFYGFPVASGGGVTASAQTWAWNGTDWAQVGGGSAPTSDFPPAGVMFTAGDHVLLLPGSSVEVGGRDVTQTWEWDGARWTLLHPALDLPGGISPFVGAYDPDTHQLVVNDEIDTWIWNESTWRRVHPTVQLPALGYVAYLPALHQVVSWGDVSRGLDAGTYGWTGTDWSVIRSGSANPAQEVGKGYLGLMTPDEAATAVRPLLTGVHPVLLPTYMPAGWDAVVTITPDGFSILYQSDQRDKSITFGIIVPNPPPGGPQSKDSFVKFRQALALKYQKPGYAEYFVYDATNPLSQRWLMWIEPGTMNNPPLAGPGVPYFLSATGVADAEFWQVANSLK